MTAAQETDTDIRIQKNDFKVGEEYDALCRGLDEAGAVTFFVGRVRREKSDAAVDALELEHYSGMTETLISNILEEACARWPIQRIRVVHRVGCLQPGEQIVFVGVAAAHRGDSFSAAHFVMDYLKTQATFWKREQREGSSQWLDQRQSDQQALDKWRT